MFYPTLWRNGSGSLWDEMSTMRRAVDRLFDTRATQSLAAWTPVVDVRETDEEIRVSAELPGLKTEDVHVTVQNGVLTISGEKKDQKEEKDATFYLYERTYGRFERSFTLPRSVIADKVKAEFADGVLSVTLPKTADAKPRRIQIEPGQAEVKIGTPARAA